MADPLRAGLLAGVPHGFSTRDDADAIIRALPAAAMVRAHQVHSPTARVVDGSEAQIADCDALVTARPALALAIVTADCAPVLLADADAGVIAAAHAGWRGAVGGVLENTLAAMASLGARADRVRAAIGPTIAQPSYEVDAGFADALDAQGRAFLEPGREGHFQFDLPGYVAMRLRAAGVTMIEDLACDTYRDAARFHSFRRATHRGEATGGRQTSVICLP